MNSAKSLSILLILALAVSGFLADVIIPVGSAQIGTNVNGIITSDTLWTMVNSPYTLTSPVIVDYGATLTVQPGVTMNLNSYNLQVNGILQSIGSNDNNIVFDSSGGNVVLTASSSSWNQQANTGCIIENSVFNNASVSVSSAAPKIDNNTINNIDSENGAVYMESGAPMISNNNINGDIQCLDDASPTITNNFIHGGINGAGFDLSAPVIINNTIEGGTSQMVPGSGIYDDGSNYYVANNTIFACATGIDVTDGIATIVGNLILNNTNGIYLAGGEFTTILHNTICNNTVGVGGSRNAGSVAYNNLVSNFQYTLSGNLTFNWWGTTNQQTIGQTLPSSANFIPFLTAPDPQAPSIPNISIPPTPSPSPTTSPSASPSPSSTPAPTSTADSLSNPTPIPASTQNPNITQNSPTNQPTSSPSQSLTSIPEFPWILTILPLCAMIFSVVLIIKHRRTTSICEV
ncbi:MAG TPA: right-handed parallel beta-helix repeat-containing protein [Candidatus Acidoferrum sp.]|nr:right-handed parallel beta-helix repeat-containing protein [Candidatus Acidoferrum sp.]